MCESGLNLLQAWLGIRHSHSELLAEFVHLLADHLVDEAFLGALQLLAEFLPSLEGFL